MPVQRTVQPARCASGTTSAPSDARLLSALATLRDALAPDVALNLPAVLDEAALLACLSVLTTDTTTAPAPGSIRPTRFNFAGYCIMCGLRGCASPQCVADFADTTWAICPTCDGAGVEPVSSIRWLCWGGLVEVDGDTLMGTCPNPADSRCSCPACRRTDPEQTWTVRTRPARSNLAVPQ